MYVYEDHLGGGMYASCRELSYEERYCEQCGDTDWLIGYAATKAEAWDLLKDNTDIDGCGGWDYNYIQTFINENWDE